MPDLPDPSDTSPDRATLDVRNREDEVDRLRSTLEEVLVRHGYSSASVFAVRLAMEEAVSNAFRHGHAQCPEDPIHVEFVVDSSRVTVSVEDRGRGFDPGAVPDPTHDENLDKPSGRGLLLIRAYMSDMRFNDRGNRVEMEYRRPGRG
ncbi:MAG: ATP-binding protein [Phycisphaeraceae bacterium]|nr:ATP-binding protein [Phycisphaeraceae bacterium]